jgi:hypothetical protein
LSALVLRISGAAAVTGKQRLLSGRNSFDRPVTIASVVARKAALSTAAWTELRDRAR